jgi:hypothetical protein
MTEPATPKRKPAAIDTERMAAIRACANHLKDLERAHDHPPADVPLPSNPVPRLISPVPSASWCTSPAQLCAELAE